MNNEKLKNKVFEALDKGLLTWEQVAIACIKYMSTDDVADMIRANEFIDEEDEDEDIDEDETYVYKFPEEVTDNDVYVGVSKYGLIFLGRTDNVFIKGSFSQLLKFAKEHLGLTLNTIFLCEEEYFDYERYFKTKDINNQDDEVLKHNIASYMIKVGLHYASVENHNWTVDCDDIMRKFDLSHDVIIELLKQIATEGIIEEVGCECVADIEYSAYDCDGININFYMDYIPREYIDIDKIEINHVYCSENEENKEEK